MQSSHTHMHALFSHHSIGPERITMGKIQQRSEWLNSVTCTICIIKLDYANLYGGGFKLKRMVYKCSSRRRAWPTPSNVHFSRCHSTKLCCVLGVGMATTICYLTHAILELTGCQPPKRWVRMNLVVWRVSHVWCLHVRTVQTGGRTNKSKCLLCVIVMDIGQYVELFLGSFSTLIFTWRIRAWVRVGDGSLIRRGHVTILRIVLLMTI